MSSPDTESGGPPPRRISPPLGPDGKPLKVQVGPDGKPKGPPLGPDGKPLKPPVDKDGKPLPPPPIIGPDGKEIPRPTDSEGRPLPIYINKEGKPILDNNGKPIPLRFDHEGKPIPLDSLGGGGGGGGGGVVVPNSSVNTATNIPNWFLFVAILDTVMSLLLAGAAGYYIYELDKKSGYIKTLIYNAVGGGVGCILAFVLVIGTKKKNVIPIYIWIVCGMVLMIPHIVAVADKENEKDAKNVSLAGVIISTIRLFLVVVVGCFISFSGDDQQQRYYNPNYGGGGSTAYPRNQTVVVQQPTSHTIVQPVAMPAYGYGYPAYGGYYGGYPGYYGGAYADSMALGFAAGAMMGGGYGYGYDYDYGWGGGYYDDMWF